MNILIKDLHKSYQINNKIKQIVLKGLNLEIKQGEFCAIIGPSGSGKTTLLNLLGCIDRPDAGRIYFDQQEITELREKQLIQIRRNKIGYIFQFFNLIPTLTALENAQMPFWYARNKEHSKFNDNLSRLYKEIGIDDLKSRYPKQLSGGQQQRVAIARALANFPEFVLADEPTGNLDSVNTREIMELMKQESKSLKASFLVATHDFSLLNYFDKVITLKDGVIDSISLNN